MKSDNKFPPTHPGKILINRFFEPRNLTVEAVARAIQIPLYQLQDLIEGREKITPELAYRLGIYFKVGAEGFLNLQQIYDLEIWKDRQELIVKKQVHPYQENKANYPSKDA